MRIVAFLGAAGALILTILLPALDAGMLPRGGFVVPLALALGLGLAGVLCGRRELRPMASWLVIALVGQAVSLQLIEAGPSIGYPHYVPLTRLFAPAYAHWTALLLLQLVLVVVTLWRGRASLPAWPGGDWSRGRVLLVILIISLTSTALSREVPRFLVELVFAAILQCLHLATLLLAVSRAPADWLDAFGRRIDRWLDGGAQGGRDRFLLLACLWAVLVTAALSNFAYERHPHVPDEVVYLIHAKYFARGLLEMPAPPVREAFDLDLMTYEPARWYSPVPPGWPAVLALGALVGLPWLVNPLLSGVSVLFAYRLLRRVYDLRIARMATVLLCTSPWFLFLGMSFMSHQLTLAAGLGAALAVARFRAHGSAAWTLPAGVAIGMLAIIRPLEGLIAAVLLGFWALGAHRPFGQRFAGVGLMAVASMAAAALILPYNRHFTGRATYFPIMAYTDAQYGVGSNAMGFGPNRGLPFGALDAFPGHGLPDVVVNAALNLFEVNAELLGWATGSLLLLAAWLTSRAWRREDLWMFAVILAVIFAHSFYWFSGGPDFGARYWYLILLPCIVLCARGLEQLAKTSVRENGTRALLGAVVLCAASLFIAIPWRAADKYHHYRSMRPDVRQLASQHDFGRSLVLVRGRRMPDYMSAAPYNPIDLQADAAIYAWAASADVERRVVEAYRDRPIWILEGPSVTGDGFRVVDGPLDARQLLRENAHDD